MRFARPKVISMTISTQRLGMLVALLLSSISCTGGDEPAGPEAPQRGRVLEALPAAPVVQAEAEALPGSDGPLAVVASRPQGEVEGSFHPTITFSKPIVALQAVESEQQLRPPARIVPDIPGEWRWLGSSSVEFVPAQQLPYATTFEVTVPAGLVALDGSKLDRPHRFSFSTPRPLVQRLDPRPGFAWLGPRPRFTLIVNQPVVDLARAAHLLEVNTGKRLPLVVVEAVSIAQELEAKEQGRRHGRMEGDPFRNQQMRYVLEPAAALPLDTELLLVIDAGLQAVQGPLTHGHRAEWKYFTYGPMRVDAVQKCLWNEGNCPWGPVVLRTTNRADVATLRQLLVVTPAVEIDWEQVESHLPTGMGLDPRALGGVAGQMEAGYRLSIRIAAGLPDEFGQRAPAFEAEVLLDDRSAAYDAGGRVALLESKGDASLPIETVNLASVEVEVWPLDPAEMARTLARNKPPAGAAALRTTLDTSAERNRTKWTPLDLRQALGGKPAGLFATRIEAPALEQPWKSFIVGQVTDLAVHTKLGATSGVVWVTSLSAGAPVPDAALELYDREGQRKWQGRTDAQGMALVPGLSELLPKEDTGYHWEAPFALVVATKEDQIGAALSTWMDGIAPAAFDLPMDWDGRERKSLGIVFADRGITGRAMRSIPRAWRASAGSASSRSRLQGQRWSSPSAARAAMRWAGSR